MSNANPSALLRTLIVYAICVPVAIFVGYLVTDPLQQQSMLMVAIVLGFLVFPILIKWHYPLLVLSWSLPVTLFFVKGHPNLFLAMVAISLTISVVERTLDRKRRGLSVPSMRWALLAFLAVIYMTAKLTGGFGLRAMGSEIYGGKKYIFLVVGALSFFALAARPIPKKDANFYMGLFLLPGIVWAVSDLFFLVPDPLRFIYLLIPPNAMSSGFGDETIVLGQTRLSGMSAAGTAVFCWMLARHGFRDCVLTAKLWRPMVLLLSLACISLGGFRSAIITVVLTAGLIFYLEKLHRTGAMLAVLMLGILGGALLVPLAPHLPYTFQRCLAFLPLNISNAARMDAEESTEWRLRMWEALLPKVPEYLLLGKGYAFSAETFDESMGQNPVFKSIDPADDPLALASDFHSGPLSVVLPLGIWGVLAWLWFWLAGFFVVWRNYHYGDADLRHVNAFLLASFGAKCIIFLLVSGSMVSDIAGFAGVVGLSVAINHGVMRRKAPAVAAAQPAPAAPRRSLLGRPALPPQPSLPAVGG